MTADDPSMQLQIPTHSDAGDHMELLNHVQKGGYEVAKEYASDHIAVYNVYPQPERDNGRSGVPNFMTSAANDDGRRILETVDRDEGGRFVSADD